jgi:hypothetical protein
LGCSRGAYAGRSAWTDPSREVLAAEAGENAQKRTSELHFRYYSAVGLDWPGRGEGLSDRESEILALITRGQKQCRRRGADISQP